MGSIVFPRCLVAGVSIGSIYHHFGNKEALAKALYDELLQRMDAGLAEGMERESDCHARGT